MRRGSSGVAILLSAMAVAACVAFEEASSSRPHDDPDASGGNERDGAVDSALSADEIIPTPLGEASTEAPAPTSFPSTLPLTGWWRANYSGAPWLGGASAGTSAQRDLNSATNAPDIATALNGFTPANFNGIDDWLDSALPISSYLASTAWEVHGLFSADTARPHSPGVAYNFPALLGETVLSSVYVAFSSAGVIAGHTDGASYKEVLGACATGGIHAFQAWFDGTALNVVIDGGAPATPVPAGPAVLGNGFLRVGAAHGTAPAAAFDGRIVELMTADKVLGAPARAGVRAYFNERYRTAFPL